LENEFESDRRANAADGLPAPRPYQLLVVLAIAIALGCYLFQGYMQHRQQLQQLQQFAAVAAPAPTPLPRVVFVTLQFGSTPNRHIHKRTVETTTIDELGLSTKKTISITDTDEDE